MKSTLLICALGISSFAVAQDKPRIFVAGKGTQNVSTNGSEGGNRWFRSGRADSTIGAHDESMEVTKDLQKNCVGVIITINQPAADYTIMLDRESKQNRGLLRSNSQIQVANRLGDVLGANATHSVSNAAKDACELILADWKQNGRIAPVPAVQPIPAQPAPAQPQAQPASQPVTSAQPQPAVQPAVQSAVQSQQYQGANISYKSSDVSSVDGEQTSLGDAARAARASKQ
jgi:hypothetical protein